MNEILEIIKNGQLTYEQQVLALAREAENTLSVLNIDEATQKLREDGIICDLFEGHAPYRPRYIVPDYEKFMAEGCKFLDLQPAEDLNDAINNLLIFYRHVPSITSFPVYIGNIDQLLNPYVKDDDESFKAIKRFLKHIDRTITDSFCHANIGPEETLAGRMILRAERELQTSIPNLTFKLSDDTNKAFVIEGIKTMMATAKPSFANHGMFSSEFGEDYGIASCYNGLHIGGGSYTLVRMNLAELVKLAETKDDFIQKQLPYAVEKMAAYMKERIRFLNEETPFFSSNFLVEEGFIDKDKFTAMFGMVGLAEAVNHFYATEDIKTHFGHNSEADQFGLEVIEALKSEVEKYEDGHCKISDNKYLLHAQVGIDTDLNSSPGCRIPIGEEPLLYDHLKQAGLFHKYFPSGIGDIFSFDETVHNNHEYVYDIIKGAFKNGMRYFSGYGSDADVIRITGYLVKKSEMEKLNAGEKVLRDTVALGLGAVKNQKVLERKLRD